MVLRNRIAHNTPRNHGFVYSLARADIVHDSCLGNVSIEDAEVDLLLVVVGARGEVAITTEMDIYVLLCLRE